MKPLHQRREARVHFYFLSLLVLICASGCQTVESYDQRRSRIEFTLVDQTLSMKNIDFLEEFLLQDRMVDWVRECLSSTFTEKDALWIERYYYYLREKAALGAACGCSLDFDQLLVRYYYKDLETASALNDEAQLMRAVQRLVRIGPRNEKERSFPGWTPMIEQYRIKIQSVGDDEAIVKVSVFLEGELDIILRRRLVKRVEVWIPVDFVPGAIY